jgi:hypothetical protein
MAPPANTTFATAVTISTFPFTFTQSDINDAGTNFNVFYRFIAPAGATVVGVWGFSGNVSSGYQPTCEPFDGPVGSPTRILFIAGQNIPVQFPVVPGNEYFLEFIKNVNTAGPEHIDISLIVHADSAIADGTIAVPDDTVGFPLAVMSQSIDNTAIAFVPGMPAGEGGDITTNGIMCLENSANARVDIYNRSFALVVSRAISGNNLRVRTCRGVNKFYVGSDESPPHVRVITEAGVVGGTVFALSGTNLESLAADNTEAILYYCAVGFGVPVKRWDLVNNIALSDLVGSVATYQSPDILVLADGTIIVLYYNSTTKDVQAKQYSAAGALLNTYSLGAQTGTTKPRMGYATDDPNSFWVFTHIVVSTNGSTVARNIKASDGTILTTRTWMEYEGGAYNGHQTATPLARFGNSFSCPFFVMMGGTPNLSGVYFMDTITHDAYNTATKKIPDPTIRTALIGE